jgi:hypothetical protein
VLLQHEGVSGLPQQVAFWGFIETTPYLCTTFPHLLFPCRSPILYNNPNAIEEKVEMIYGQVFDPLPAYFYVTLYHYTFPFTAEHK